MKAWGPDGTTIITTTTAEAMSQMLSRPAGGAFVGDYAGRDSASAKRDHSIQPRPLVSAGRPVLVDRHLICAACGNAVEPAGPDTWRHVPRGRRLAGRSKWLSPLTLAELRKLETYEAFKARFATAVRSDLGLPFTTTEDQWREALRRLDLYETRLHAARRWRTLGAVDNPYLDLFTILTAAPLPPAVSEILDLRGRRRELAALFSWAIPTNEALDVLAKHAPLLECGAGMGYWSALLQARGVDVIAYDLAPPNARAVNRFHIRDRKPWSRIRRGSSEAAVGRHPDRTLFLCWPPYEDDDASYAALRAYRGEIVIYVGERHDGATGSVRFHRELRLNWTLTQEIPLPRWPRLSDTLMVYRRNVVRQPHRERDRCFECQRFIRTGGIGRCDRCFENRPTALALRAGPHRVEYPPEAVDAMPPAQRRALEASPNRISASVIRRMASRRSPGSPRRPSSPCRGRR